VTFNTSPHADQKNKLGGFRRRVRVHIDRCIKAAHIHGLHLSQNPSELR